MRRIITGITRQAILLLQFHKGGNSMNTGKAKKVIASVTTAAVVAGAIGGTMIYRNHEDKVLAGEIHEAEQIASSYHSSDSGKNETVYVITDGNGERTTYVSSWLHNPDGSSWW